MASYDRYVCIHGHFYQPPRENPWLERIELQDSAYPYHDWNERITAECYAPNAASRILDSEGFVTRIVNNYSRISFNFGPTLLHWMKDYAPDTYEAILEADRKSMSQFSGHGSAIAQAYNHTILPLSNDRDKVTQIVWGIRDFTHRFGRRPEGMWLAETAVDNRTLEILADHGILFTILAPHQAKRVKPLMGARQWKDVSGDRVDPKMPYLVRLPSGKTISVFFYDGPISRGIAFEGLLTSGETFANRLKGAFVDGHAGPQLVHIATDGETYGHHHRHGDMALAYALQLIENEPGVGLTNYGEYLERFPPTWEAEISENTAWSCAHGVERWRSHCGCATGGHAGWNQNWRLPLRNALDWLRDRLAPLFESAARELVADPWATREDYIDFILVRSEENLNKLLHAHGTRVLNAGEKSRLLELLEMQRHAMLMYTSCAWFFDEVSGIETVQNIQYAGRVIQLAQRAFGAEAHDLEVEFIRRLSEARSNIPDHRDGGEIYRKFVKPSIIEPSQVVIHSAVTSLFSDNDAAANDVRHVYSFDVNIFEDRLLESGKMKLYVGQARVHSEVTLTQEELGFAILHWGDHNLNAGARRIENMEQFRAMIDRVTGSFKKADFPDVLRTLDRYYGECTYSLKSLFRDEQRHVLDRILQSTRSQVESIYTQLYDQHYPLMRFFRDLGNPLPPVFKNIGQLVLNQKLRRELADPGFERDEVASLLAEARDWQVPLDEEGLSLIYHRTLERIMTDWLTDKDDLNQLNTVLTAVVMAGEMPFSVDFWRLQNLFYRVLNTSYGDYRKRAEAGNPAAAEWIKLFESLGRRLQVRGQ